MSPPLVNQDGALLRKEAGLAKDQECCCDLGACCVCGSFGSVDCPLIEDSKSLVATTLANLGHPNVIVSNVGVSNSFEWTSDCCEVDPNDSETITISYQCNPEFPPVETTYTLFRCISTTPICSDGNTEQQCLNQGGVFHLGATCADDPCNPLP